MWCLIYKMSLMTRCTINFLIALKKQKEEEKGKKGGRKHTTYSMHALFYFFCKIFLKFDVPSGFLHTVQPRCKIQELSLFSFFHLPHLLQSGRCIDSTYQRCTTSLHSAIFATNPVVQTSCLDYQQSPGQPLPCPQTTLLCYILCCHQP